MAYINIEKRREAQRRYKERNRDKILAKKSAAYRKKNPIVKSIKWYSGERDSGICNNCLIPIHNKPIETCKEAKHFVCFNNKKAKNNRHRQKRRKTDPYYGTGVTKEQWVIKNRQQRRRMRFELLIRLGNKCVNCGFDNFKALEIDHINNDWKQDREKYGWKLRKEMLKMTIDELNRKFQILCANCHSIKTYDETRYKG